MKLSIKNQHELALARYRQINTTLRAENAQLETKWNQAVRELARCSADTDAANNRSHTAEQRCGELQAQVVNLLRQFERLVALQADKLEKK
jgi:hypothetical protein